ncbi:MAG: tetratricopeptide repeat protein [Verrucomicrobiales bacterium]
MAVLCAISAYCCPGLAHADLKTGIVAYNKGDYATAKKEFSAAADAKDPTGMHLLGSLYYQGHGVEKDIKRAVELFAAAAELGWRPSQTNLGLIYQSGDGVKRDIRKAIEYYMAAGKQGDLQATYQLGQIFRKGDGVDQDYARALDYYRLAVQQGYLPAVHEYGIMFANGDGVKADFVEAYGWIAYVAATGDENAKKNLAKIENALGDDLEKAKVRADEISAEITRIRKELASSERPEQ